MSATRMATTSRTAIAILAKSKLTKSRVQREDETQFCEAEAEGEPSGSERVQLQHQADHQYRHQGDRQAFDWVHEQNVPQAELNCKPSQTRRGDAVFAATECSIGRTSRTERSEMQRCKRPERASRVIRVSAI